MMDARYVPDRLFDKHGGEQPVARFELLPAGQVKHIIGTCLRLTLACGCQRHFGVEGGFINSELRMIVWGGYVNPRNELVKHWKRYKGNELPKGSK